MIKVVTAVFMLLAASAAAATPGFTPDYLFDFNALKLGTGSSGISSYMTDIYNSSVSVENAAVGQFDSTSPYIYSTDKTFTMGFDRPISGVYYDWYVFDDQPGTDFTFNAYGDVAEISSWNLNLGVGTNDDWFSGNNQTAKGGFIQVFDAPVYAMQFGGGGWHDIAIDNLQIKVSELTPSSVVPIPAPSAILLCMVGLGAVSWIRSRLLP